ADRALVLEDPGLEAGGYGNKAGGEQYLSLAEAHHLATHGLDLVDANEAQVGPEETLARAKNVYPHGELVLQAYSWLRDLDLVPRTGLKFGVHFRVYKSRPGEGHAPFLVHALPEAASWTYQDIARIVRLAHSVRKRAVVWTPRGAFTAAWTRP
ncbi:MAG: hypothetical protein R3185_07470, partial [Candidatus Thermoplasmatota archaeon]|nr:hypothetical protein [Candidatus Thermoplasmatota archaeon]